jgi:two-component system cell cycle sensor histidine kinase/response regulator CckA
VETMGFHALEAKNGPDALEKLQQHAASVQLALVDFTMPQLNGEETFRQLRRLKPNLPVILMSGHTPLELRSRFRDMDPPFFLQKPFSQESLLRVLRIALSAAAVAHS